MALIVNLHAPDIESEEYEVLVDDTVRAFLANKPRRFKSRAFAAIPANTDIMDVFRILKEEEEEEQKLFGYTAGEWDFPTGGSDCEDDEDDEDGDSKDGNAADDDAADAGDSDEERWTSGLMPGHEGAGTPSQTVKRNDTSASPEAKRQRTQSAPTASQSPQGAGDGQSTRGTQSTITNYFKSQRK